MNEQTKAELLAKYAQREPKLFRQIDGWENPDAISGDLTGGETHELMNGSDVRILLRRI